MWVCMRVKEKVTTGSVHMMEPGARFRVMTPHSFRSQRDETWRMEIEKNCHISLEMLIPFLSLYWPLSTLTSDLQFYSFI